MKAWFLFILMPTLAFGFNPTSEKNCAPLDLRSSALGDVRDQHEVAWCYAFTGADMLGLSYDLPERVSAADVALGYNQTKYGHLVRWFKLNVTNRKDEEIRKLAHQTGFNKFSLEHVVKEGWCPERIFPSEKWTKMNRTETGWVASEVKLRKAMLEISALHDVRGSLTTTNLPYYYQFKNVDQEKFVQLLKTKKLASFYSALRHTVCQDDRQAFDSKFPVKMVIKNANIFRSVSEQMNAGRLVGLDYNALVLQNSANRGLNIKDLHTSGIVGRRWNRDRKSCEFLIRDSHGDKCDEKYDPTYECDAGNVWISESTLYKNMISIVYMKSTN